uniref:VSP2 n=1 Tax=Hevea brasiliensis TaxID=3981 RepID=A0A1B2G268_HEVBR|nr:VSP2 [Hevea brasiliensis]
MLLPGLFLFFSLFSLVFSNEPLNSHLLPRPLILEYPENIIETTQFKQLDNELQLQCTSWRFAVEANNLNPWKTIPQECAEYVRDYVMGRGYRLDLERVSNEAGVYAKSVQMSGDGQDAWVFDVDETLLSNLPYYADHGYGLEIFDPVEFDKWVGKAVAPAIEPSLKLYKEVLGLGFKVFLLTGRSEKQRSVTEENLINAGFQDWDKLILRGLRDLGRIQAGGIYGIIQSVNLMPIMENTDMKRCQKWLNYHERCKILSLDFWLKKQASDDHGKLATIYKSEKRSEMVKDGYRILGNSGDQWSDLLGSPTSNRSFKLPNPMYYIP